MARWKFLMLAGFLGWPAISLAQTGPGGNYAPPILPPGATPPQYMTGAPNTLPPGVPPLPSRIGQQGAPATQGQPTLPNPNPMPGQMAPRMGGPGMMPPGGPGMMPPGGPGMMPGGPGMMPGGPGVAVPDVTGMPHPELGVMPAGMPPGTCPPIPPVPNCPPPPEPECTPGGASGLFFRSEILYMKPRRIDPVALLTTQIDPTTSGSALFNYDTNYHLAYRLGGGYLDRSGWLFLGEYTRFKDTVSNQVLVNDTTASSLQYVGPGLLGSLINLQPGALSAQWNLNYQTLDVSVGAVVSPSTVLDVIISGGGRLANIDQRYVTVGDNTGFGGTNRTAENLESNLRGAGPRVGSEARLYLTPGWMAYGRAHTSILLAQREENSVVQQPGSVQFITYNRNELVPSLELATGIEAVFLDGHLIVGCGYEWNYFFELGSTNVEFAGNARLNRHVDIGLEGASLRVSFLW